ncbi:hypothetical protein PAMP_004749 [Pampus punctatissimus]
MSVAGFKKQFYKASQLVSEKVGGAEGTKLDEDFKDLERRADITSKAVVEILNKTSEYLQPNPATRAKLSMLNTVSKIRGQVNSPGYPQPEGLLGECMTKYGRDMGEDTNFGGALIDIGDSMKRMAEIKDSLDIDVKQNFIDPLQAVADKDIKDIQHHLKKLEGRRLDYDYKKKRQGKIPDEEIKQALEKFHESKELSESSMHNLLETDPQHNIQVHPSKEPRSGADRVTEPCCKALYDFEPENEGELGFHEGDIITLVNRIDENWFEGTLHGRSGYFPNNYVEVVVPLSH